MQIQNIPTENLVEYARNPRKNDAVVDKMVACIKEFGFRIPIVAKSDGTVVDGHLRLKAARKMGLTEVPVVNADDLTEAQIKAFRLVANQSANWAEWDEELLKLEFKDLEDLNYDLELTGFDLDDIQRQLDEFEGKTVEEDDFDESEMSQEESPVITKSGDLWILGDHRLLCGDSTKKEYVGKLMNGEKADMVFTDPPYGMGLNTDWSGAKSNPKFYKEKGCKGTGNKYEQGVVDEFTPEIVNNLFACFSYVREIFLFGADYFAELLPNKNDGSWIVWDKRSNDDTNEEYINQADKMFGSCFELCWSKNKHRREIARVKWASIFGTEKEFDHKRCHPTQKPTALARWFFERYSEANQLIVDLFGGSGSTLIACEQLNRKCYMMEIDEHYCDVIIKRWQKLTGNVAILESTGKTFDEIEEKAE